MKYGSNFYSFLLFSVADPISPGDGRLKREAALKAEQFFEEVRVKEEGYDDSGGPAQDNTNDYWQEIGFGKRLLWAPSIELQVNNKIYLINCKYCKKQNH